MRINYSWLMAAAGMAVCLLGSGLVTAQEATKATCPVKGIEFQPTATTKSVMVNGQKLSFCCGGCPAAFAKAPEQYVKTIGNCPVNKGGAAKVAPASRLVVNNDLYYFCCGNCPKGFAANLANFVKELKDPVTGQKFAVKADSPRQEHEGQLYVFANEDTKANFKAQNAIVYGK